MSTVVPLDHDAADHSSDDNAIRVRTLFLSDVHLGVRGCQADKLLDFLRCYDADTIYLVGDIIDGWALKSTWYWPQAHNDVVQKLLRKGAQRVAALSIFPVITTNFCATTSAPISAGSRCAKTPSMSRSMASAIS